MSCSRSCKGTDNEHGIYDANRAIRNDASILFAERNKKRGWKRKKAQSAFEVSISCSTRVEQGLFLRSSQRISSRTLSTLKTSNTTRLVSLIITGMLLLLLGVRRGLVGHRNIVLTALETLGIVAAAALAGFLIGKLVTHQTKDGLIA